MKGVTSFSEVERLVAKHREEGESFTEVAERLVEEGIVNDGRS